MWLTMKLAARSVLRQRGRSLLTLIAIAGGVLTLVLAGGFVQDVLYQLREFTIRSQLGHVQIYKKGYYEFGRQDLWAYQLEGGPALVATLEGMDEVELATMRLEFSGLISNGEAELPILGQGVKFEQEARLGSQVEMVAGEAVEAGDAMDMLIGEGVANALQLEPGDSVSVLVSAQGGGVNTMAFRIAGVFRTFSEEYDARAVQIDLDTAKDLLQTAGVHSVVVVLKDTEATNAFARTLHDRLRTIGLEWKTWTELADFYAKTVELYKRQFGVLKLIILLMVLLTVANSVTMGIVERTGEFGTLMALGRKPSWVYGLVVMEGGVLGLVGASAGCVLGVVIAALISSVGIPMPPPPGSAVGYLAEIRPLAGTLLEAGLVGLAATVLATVFSGLRLLRLPIVDALRAAV